MEQEPPNYTIHTSLLFISQGAFFKDKPFAVTISPSTGKIVSVAPSSLSPTDPVPQDDIDLRSNFTVLPGFVDAHTHIFLHPYSEAPALNQMRDESFVSRIVRATAHCRAALKAGYTTYRDLGTEGAFDADIGVRDCINRGLIPGPRLFVATEALASSGSYAIRQENHLGGVSVPRLADECDGPVGVRAAVRRRIGAGADVIKFYADYRRRTLRFPPPTFPGAPPIGVPPSCCHAGLPGESISNPNALLFTQEEMNEIVAEARRAGAPVAAHASTPRAVQMACIAGVDTIEHAFLSDPKSPDSGVGAMAKFNSIFVPTLSVLELNKVTIGEEAWRFALRQVHQAFIRSVTLACGGDTGPFAHGDNAREMELMLEAGLPLENVLQAATLGGWKACGSERCGYKFGSLAPDWSADVVVLEGDVREDIGALRRIKMVIKDGKVVVRDGVIVE
ncbi:hypothetical protein IAT38_003991 [Cryptococcus sp. DSM 104549]